MHATDRGQSSTGCAITFSTRAVDVVLNCSEEYNMQEEGASSKQYT